ncbi:hypothetical protein [Echinicola strongylocentroti]|nr:hypothetical protein [Echinicola strongylocentroti]
MLMVRQLMGAGAWLLSLYQLEDQNAILWGEWKSYGLTRKRLDLIIN